MKKKMRLIDLRDHPEADLSANTERGAIAGGVAGALVGTVFGLLAGPGGAALGALFGFFLGAFGSCLVVAVMDNQGERNSRSRLMQDLTLLDHEQSDRSNPTFV